MKKRMKLWYKNILKESSQETYKISWSFFSDDSVVYEPFSKSKRLFGKAEIEPFLRSVIMANEGVQYESKILQQKNNSKDNLVALVTFRKENEIRARLTFAFESSDHFKFIRRIKSLLIEFID